MPRRLQASQADLQDAQVTLAKNVATAYIGLRAAQQRLLLARQTEDLRARILTLTHQRRRLGTASDGDVETAMTELEQAQGNLHPVAAQADTYLDELAALLGQEPGTLDALIGAPAALPLPPAQTAIGNPADLLRRRPDIRGAERRLAAVNETIGANIAQYFPQVSLLGFVGVVSNGTANLLSSRNLTALGVPSLTWNIRDFPKIGPHVTEARANYAAQEASYRQTVLLALRDANEALSTFGHRNETVATLIDRQASADHLASIARLRNDAGTASTLTRAQGRDRPDRGAGRAGAGTGRTRRGLDNTPEHAGVGVGGAGARVSDTCTFRLIRTSATIPVGRWRSGTGSSG